MGMKLESSWHQELAEEIGKPYIAELKNFLSAERSSGKSIFPPEPLVFNAFLQTPFHKVKVVIIGQDPYHGPNQAHGLCFSVQKGTPLPPSLKNIYQELQQDLGIPPSPEGNLLSWAQQGVLLLNATLTVCAHQPKSHYGRGWERFTDAVVAHLVARQDPLVFVLWGKSAQEKVQHILGNKSTHHAVLTAPHPSPFSAYSGFFGCRHFSQVNALLEKWGKTPIDWTVHA